MAEDREYDGEIYKSFYGIIPGTVRYDTNLCPNAKLMYCEITALCNSMGACWANNNYFAELYNVSTKSISNWISQLEKNLYIRTEYRYKKGTKSIEKRYIYVPSSFYTYGRNVLGGIENNFYTGMEEKFHGGIEKKFSDNNITLEDNINNICEDAHTGFPPSVDSIPPKEKPVPKPKDIQAKKTYGKNANVLLSADEYEKLSARNSGTDAIEFLSEYIEMKGYKAKSHYLAICKWVFTALQEKVLKDKEIAAREQRLAGGGGGYQKANATSKSMQGSTDYSKLLKRGGE